MTVAEFIVHRFIPEYVFSMRPAGRDYFHYILKHVLSPERLDPAFEPGQDRGNARLAAILGWPYLDAIQLSDVDAGHIQEIIAAALEHGYSIQTATHIRNVIRRVFSYAHNTSCLQGENPAARVILPPVVRTEPRVLTLDQMRLVFRHMRYPEREVAILGVLTGMRVAEIFALKWKYVNLKDTWTMADGEWISPRAIAIRNLIYRNQIGNVTASRKREIRIPDQLLSMLFDIRTRTRSLTKESFVFSSRSGTPINRDNITRRRLRLIGTQLDMPWLSWNVFYRTRVGLDSRSRVRLYSELKSWLPESPPQKQADAKHLEARSEHAPSTSSAFARYEINFGSQQIRGFEEHLIEAMKTANAARVTCTGTLKQVRAKPMDIVACVLHELQTPITAILSAGENVRDGLLENKDSLREEGTIIVAQAMRLMSLGDQIQLYASTGKAGPRRVMRALTAVEVIDCAVSGAFILLQQGGFTLEREIQPGLPALSGDLSLLSQCLQNLIANAVKYSGESRWVGVSAVVGEASSTGQNEIHISVHDHGLGISKEDVPHVFEPFYRSRRPPVSKIRGSGLGLSIAKGCAEACGGTLSVVSEECVGCVFTLHLPLHKELRRTWPSKKSVSEASDERQPILEVKVGQS
jgi:signal transduction histidine kinase